MFLTETLRTAWESLRSNPVRSSLTVLGVVIGVASVILLVSVGEGARTYLVQQFAGLGTHVIMVQPGKVRTVGALGGGERGLGHPLTLRDAEALDRCCSALSAVSAVVNGSGPIRYGSRTRNVFVLGVEPDYPEIRHIGADVGRFIGEDDLRGRRRVAVLGRTVARELFGRANPLGQPITIAGARFRVVGLIQAKGMSLGFDFDDLAIIPASTADEVFHTEGLALIVTQARSAEVAPLAVAQIEATLRRRHRDDDFTVVQQEAMLASLFSITRMMTAFLALLGSISLGVGGVGIMNILLVSVSERTREIGLRKALGARGRDILLQFLGEAVAVAVLGGVLGVALGLGGAVLVHRLVPAIAVQASAALVLGATGFAALVGVVFGIAPARSAARLHPIVALGRE